MNRTKFILILLLTITSFSNARNKKESDKKISEIEIVSLKNEVLELKNEIKIIERSISSQKEQNSAQLDFYKENQNTIFWMISFFLVIIGGAFILFGYLFKRPDDIWKKIKITENEVREITSKAYLLLERLEFQYNHQESIFILGKKGLFSFTEEDWNLVKIYAKNASVISQNERKATDWLLIGLNFYKQKKYEESISSYKKGLEVDSNSEIIWKHLGNAYDEILDFENSIKAYNRVIQVNPNSDIAFNNLGIVYCGLNNFKEAETNFLTGIRLNPDNCFIYTNYFELCLTNDLEIEDDLINNFTFRFKNNKEAMTSYSMIRIYKRIIAEKIENIDNELNEWENKYKTIANNESFRNIENWIYKEHNEKYRGKLLKALNRFSKYSEYKNDA